MENLKYLGIGLGIGLLVILLAFSILATFGFFSNNSGLSKTVNSDSNIPGECKKPEGQDIESWKEHLGHHENTKYCLEYYK